MGVTVSHLRVVLSRPVVAVRSFVIASVAARSFVVAEVVSGSLVVVGVLCRALRVNGYCVSKRFKLF